VTASALRMLVQVHGALAWLSVLALAGALLVARWRPALVTRVVPAAVALGAAAFVTGVMLHGPFQRQLRQRLFLSSSALGWLFERKEHVAFGALALSGCGLFALWASVVAARGAAPAAALRRAYLLALGAALAFEVFALVVSIATARRVGF